jgi:hypothetical protein
MATATAFSLADLETFDGHAQGSGAERRFLCPLCGEGKPRNAAHRCLNLNAQSGVWNCKRCKATGKLTDFWTERPKLNPRDLAQQRRRQLSRLPDESPQPVPQSTADWREQLKGARSIDGTAAENYLRGRGVCTETARAAGVMFAPCFYGKPAVTFPICDCHGAQTGASGRYMSTHATPKTRIAGTKRNGVFTAPDALKGKDGAPVIITEAPIDALSLATAGYPALALCGTSGPAWMHLVFGLKRVLLAFDADEPGDEAAASLAAHLAPYGARCERLRPQSGKDWNEALQRDGADALADWLAVRVLIEKDNYSTVPASHSLVTPCSRGYPMDT